ncbi:aspartate/glutamate racemase family protein [Luteipulveratus mongoliensis]|uniref:Racemase n=1 Tax=Luteipulveratus mongoliensis TaxID=571913 RepID=A0A0K1JDN0_9MICO|nr:aspartate/glutamate racemase family protein [Luteipulveratus mongoliensis]AKU14822.1 racemase [Luteipulveratus mongoliensis]
MRTIGMLGGMSWESTAIYYRRANELTRERLGGLHSAPILLHSVDFAPIERLQVAGDWHAAGEILAEAAVGLERAGAGLLVLCTNTMHLVAPQIEDACDIPLLHIVDVTADHVAAQGISRVGLLATAFTMEQPFYVERMAERGIECIVPDAKDRAEVHRVIYDELCQGVVREESRASYRTVIERLVARGVEGIVLGCTELELLVGQDDSPVPVFATTSLHVTAAIDAAQT